VGGGGGGVSKCFQLNFLDRFKLMV
jgi:hypothetical protein